MFCCLFYVCFSTNGRTTVCCRKGRHREAGEKELTNQGKMGTKEEGRKTRIKDITAHTAGERETGRRGREGHNGACPACLPTAHFSQKVLVIHSLLLSVLYKVSPPTATEARSSGGDDRYVLSRHSTRALQTACSGP